MNSERPADPLQLPISPVTIKSNETSSPGGEVINLDRTRNRAQKYSSLLDPRVSPLEFSGITNYHGSLRDYQLVNKLTKYDGEQSIRKQRFTRVKAITWTVNTGPIGC